jgi:hypothetical protein
LLNLLLLNKNRVNQPSKYTKELLCFLENEENYPQMIEWIGSLPELDQPDVLREMEAVFKERHLKTGEQDWLDKANLIANGVDNFEEEILDHKLDKALFSMRFEDLEIDPAKFELYIIEVRENLIKSILSNPNCDKKLWDLAHKIIEVEKDSGFYNAVNWSAIIPI